MKPIAEHKQIENCRRIWAKVAKENGWYREPFYVQVWIDPQNGLAYDAVSWPTIEQDFVIRKVRKSNCCNAKVIDNSMCNKCLGDLFDLSEQVNGESL